MNREELAANISARTHGLGGPNNEWRLGVYLEESDWRVVVSALREAERMREAMRSVVNEVQWFVLRQKNLGESVEGSERTWADVLDEDLEIARAALKEGL